MVPVTPSNFKWFVWMFSTTTTATLSFRKIWITSLVASLSTSVPLVHPMVSLNHHSPLPTIHLFPLHLLIPLPLCHLAQSLSLLPPLRSQPLLVRASVSPDFQSGVHMRKRKVHLQVRNRSKLSEFAACNNYLPLPQFHPLCLQMLPLTNMFGSLILSCISAVASLVSFL